jgi:hypothetical protein
MLSPPSGGLPFLTGSISDLLDRLTLGILTSPTSVGPAKFGKSRIVTRGILYCKKM